MVVGASGATMEIVETVASELQQPAGEVDGGRRRLAAMLFCYHRLVWMLQPLRGELQPATALTSCRRQRR